jgi:hypothetical protein
MTVSGNVFKNFPEINGDITKQIADVSTHNYNKLGSDVADVLILALGPIPELEVIELINSQPVEALPINPLDAVLFVTGLVDEILDVDDFTKIQLCLTDTEPIVLDLGLALNDFKQQDIAHILAGITEIGNVLTLVEGQFNDCTSM